LLSHVPELGFFIEAAGDPPLPRVFGERVAELVSSLKNGMIP